MEGEAVCPRSLGRSAAGRRSSYAICSTGMAKLCVHGSQTTYVRGPILLLGRLAEKLKTNLMCWATLWVSSKPGCMPRTPQTATYRNLFRRCGALSGASHGDQGMPCTQLRLACVFVMPSVRHRNAQLLIAIARQVGESSNKGMEQTARHAFLAWSYIMMSSGQ